MPLLIQEKTAEKWFRSDIDFDQLYPLQIQALASRHWTPLGVARKAASFLAVDRDARILDIGSGAGKFCLAAAHFRPQAHYFGVEQRKNLLGHANEAKSVLSLENVHFLHGNFTQLNFRNFDHFYFFNAFYENLSGTDKIDHCIDYSAELFYYYNRYLYKELALKPAGTRVATFHSLEDEIPPDFLLAGTDLDNLLKFWIKA